MKIVLTFLLAAGATSATSAGSTYDQYFAKAVNGRPCYARLYDDAHMKAHPHQKVRMIEIDFDMKQGDSDRPNSQSYFEAGIGFVLKNKPKEKVGAAIYCKTAAGFFDCYIDGDGGTFHLTPQGANLKLDVTGGGGGTDAIVVDNGDDFPTFGAPGSDDRVFVLPPADRKICDAVSE